MKLNLRKLTIQLAQQIVKRTRSGKDKNLKAFKPYTPNYTKAKKSSKVDLYASGYMLGQLGPKSQDTIGFKSSIAQERARYNQGMGRQFMGLDINQLQYIQKYVHNQTEKQLAKAVTTWKLR